LEHGWTQDEFADLSGLHRAQVGAFENGRMNITLASLHLIADTLGVKIVDLFAGVEDDVDRNLRRSPARPAVAGSRRKAGRKK